VEQFPAKPNDPHDSGSTPLHIAAEQGDAASIDILCGKGAWLEALDLCAKTPLDRALQAGKQGAAAALVAKGAIQPSEGWRIIGGIWATFCCRKRRSKNEKLVAEEVVGTSGDVEAVLQLGAGSAFLEEDEAEKVHGMYGVFCEALPYGNSVVTLLLWFWFGFNIPCVLASHRDYCDELGYIGWIVLGILYLVYLRWILSGSLAKQIYRIKEAEQGYISSLKRIAEKPMLTISIECYHQESRGSGKDQHTVRVVTHRASTIFEPNYYWDQVSFFVLPRFLLL
jgi:hypothetical protein